MGVLGFIPVLVVPYCLQHLSTCKAPLEGHCENFLRKEPMTTLARIAVVAAAVGIQLFAAQEPQSWLPWLLYAAAAGIAARLCRVSELRVAFVAPTTASSHRPPTHWSLQMLLLAVGSSAMAVEASAMHDGNLVAVGAWLVSIVALGAVAWPQRSKLAVSTPPAIPRERVLLCVTVVLALLLRVLWLPELPRVYFGDESRLGMWLRTAYQDGVPQLFVMGWNTWSMLGLSLQGMFGPILGLSTVSLRLASAVFGTGAVWGTYLLGRELFDRRTAVIATAILAYNRTALDFSRLGTTHAQAMLFEAVTFFAMWRAVNTGSALAYTATGVAAALCLHTYNAAHVVPALLLGWMLLTLCLRPRALLSRWRGVVLAGFSFALVSLPWLYYLTDAYQFAHNWLQFTWMAHARQVTPQVIAAFEQGGIVGAWPLVASQLWKTWLGFTIVPAEAYQLGYRGGGMLDHISAAMFVLGLAIATRGGSRGAFLLYWWAATALTGGALTIDPPAFVRLVGLLPALCLLAALPVGSLLACLPNRPRLSAICVVVVLSAGLAENWRTYFHEHGSSSAEEISELVHFVRGVPPSSPVYLLGADNFLHFTRSVDVEQFAFDFPDRALRDIAEPAHFLPIRTPHQEAPTYLVLGPTQLGLEPYIRRLYPNSVGVDVRHKANQRLFFRYVELSPEDLAAQAETPLAEGLLATYERDGETLLQRRDPQLNFYTVESFFRAPPQLAVQAPFRVHWSGSLHIDTPGTYLFEVDAGGPFHVDLDGQAVCDFGSVSPEAPEKCRFESQLGVGDNPLAATWDAWTTESSVRLLFQMYWTRPDGIRELVPPQAFVWPAQG